MLVVEQNAVVALDSSHAGYVLEAGRVALAGTSAELRADESIRRSYLATEWRCSRSRGPTSRSRSSAGSSTGGVYASLALALVIIYRSTGVVNFAQGEMATFTTFIAWSLMNHMAYWPAFLLTCVIAFVGGVALQRT